MSVRVVARIRPLLGEAELDKDRIVHAEPSQDGKPTIVRIPSPKSAAEEFKFSFNAVYDMCSQEELFTNEVAPNVKSLFNGIDVMIFAYGVTGTGKTYTMRGGTKLHDRGVIPRLLSGIYRRGRKVAKDSNGETSVSVTLSYYEIYNDKVFDLFGAHDKRPPAGLPLREKEGKTVVVGLSEWACDDLKDFERLYIEANNNRSTAGTKLNAQSSRSHAILMVKLTQTTGNGTLVSMASAIDLAGSEDNRRTENGKERMVESASINKSLFVLSQCIDAIGRGDKRIPYRESKMTRILSLGQNNGITIMILNLSPLRSYHLDTLSSLNVSSRAKRIEVREIENEVVFSLPPRTTASMLGGHIQRQPLKPLTSNAKVQNGAPKSGDRPLKAFSVYTDVSKKAEARSSGTSMHSVDKSSSDKRTSDTEPSSHRLSKVPRHNPTGGRLARPEMTDMSAKIEQLVEQKVTEIMAHRALDQSGSVAPAGFSEEVKRRLEDLERRVENGGADPRAEGLRFLLMAKQHKERGEDTSALKMYELAVPYFPGQEKLLKKMESLRWKIQAKKDAQHSSVREVKTVPGESWVSESSEQVEQAPLVTTHIIISREKAPQRTPAMLDSEDELQAKVACEDEDDSFAYKPKKGPKHKTKAPLKPSRNDFSTTGDDGEDDGRTPRTARLLHIINSRDVTLIKGLSGVGQAKAKIIVDFLQLQDEEGMVPIQTLQQLRAVPGMGTKTVEKAKEGIAIAA